MSLDLLQRAALAKQLRIDAPPTIGVGGREAERVTVRVDCRTHQQVCSGQIFNSGTHMYEVWETDLPALESMVDPVDAADLKLVDRDLARHTARLARGEKTGRGYAPSWASSFRRVNDRDALPFISVELVSVAEKGSKRKAG